MRVWVLLVTLSILSCSGQRPPQRGAVATTPAAAPSSSVSAPPKPRPEPWMLLGREPVEPQVALREAHLDAGLPPLPDGPPCIGPEDVTMNDVRWTLRSREQERGRMRVLSGRAKAYLRLGAPPLLEIENAGVRVRGFGEGALVVARRPALVGGALVPDGIRPRGASLRSDGKLDVSVAFDGELRGTEVLPCADVTLVRHTSELLTALPRHERQVVVAQESNIILQGQTRALALFTPIWGQHKPLGAVGTLHGLPPERGRHWVSLEVCGGAILGTVPADALLGPAKAPHRLITCDEVGSASRHGDPRMERIHTCRAEIPLYLHDRVALSDVADVYRVGTLSHGALFQVDEPEFDGRVFIKPASPPVLLAMTGRFAVDRSEIDAHCKRVR